MMGPVGSFSVEANETSQNCLARLCLKFSITSSGTLLVRSLPNLTF